MKQGRLVGAVLNTLGLSLAATSSVNAATYQQLVSFQDYPPGSATVGREPVGSPTVVGNMVYGTVENGGAVGSGAVYDYSLSSSTESLVYSFGANSTDAAYPAGSLVSANSMLYGASPSGSGAAQYGAVFQVNPTTGAESLLHSFSSTDGAMPYGAPTILGSVAYGLTYAGGSAGDGVVYAINTSTKVYSNLHTFTGSTTDGAKSYGSLLPSGSLLYGMTSSGGADNAGTLFDYDAATSSYQVLYRFTSSVTDGSHPHGSLVYADGSLFGTTLNGGYSGPTGYGGSLFQYNLSTGTESVLHLFGVAFTDGYSPESSLALSGDTLYGTTAYGGTTDGGTLFSVTLPEPAVLSMMLAAVPMMRRKRQAPT